MKQNGIALHNLGKKPSFYAFLGSNMNCVRVCASAFSIELLSVSLPN